MPRCARDRRRRFRILLKPSANSRAPLNQSKRILLLHQVTLILCCGGAEFVVLLVRVNKTIRSHTLLVFCVAAFSVMHCTYLTSLCQEQVFRKSSFTPYAYKSGIEDLVINVTFFHFSIVTQADAHNVLQVSLVIVNYGPFSFCIKKLKSEALCCHLHCSPI